MRLDLNDVDGGIVFALTEVVGLGAFLFDKSGLIVFNFDEHRRLEAVSKELLLIDVFVDDRRVFVVDNKDDEFVNFFGSAIR
jgi:hypothetical protein